MTTNTDSLSVNERALLKIRELKQQLADAQSLTGEPIAIVSMACRFPRRSGNPEEFWQCLVDQTDEVGDIPEDRWDRAAFHDDDPNVPGKMYARRGVFLDNLDLMDPEFFGISPREATWVDPQQRLLLEVGWEALERAGWPPSRIGENTGVFVAWMHNDYQNEASDSFLNLNPYIATGAAGSFLCGRLAYYLGLQGPSVAVDTACSSSLVALHLAVQSLQRRECDRALVGGVNAICSPTTNILTCKLKALSPSGQSRAFDAAADGYLRGEGCGVVTLRRLSAAEKDGDPILGVIRGSAIGHNGFSSGLTAPNPKAQERVIRQALERANLSPLDVAYLEAHGTGTELGDPLEMQAAASALTRGRPSDHPLLVGSVKTNIGHLEAAAGMAGLIKVLLAIQNNKIPGQLNFETPNPHIPWDKIPVKVLTELSDWPNPDVRIAGVSAFGMSGTNAHVVVEAPDRATRRSRAAESRADSVSRVSPSPTTSPAAPHSPATKRQPRTQPQLIVLSGKDDEAVRCLADNYARHISTDPLVDLADFAYTTTVCRAHFEHRAAVIATSHDRAIEGLRGLARGGDDGRLAQGKSRGVAKVAWQFTGQGSQYAGMAQGLYARQPIFRAAIDACDLQLRAWRDESLIDVLFEHPQRVHQTQWTQPAIFAVQMGLAKLLESWGLQPDVVVGHSVGQYAAACVAGVMSWEDGLQLIGERGRLIGELPSGGRMLAVFASADDVQQRLESEPGVSLAALNGTHVVVSGPAAAVESLEREFAARGVRTTPLITSHAFHSALMDPVLDAFAVIADEVTFSPAQLPLICNVTGAALAADAALDGAYWARHIRAPVRFSQGIASARELGCELLLELGPQSVLTRMAAANWQGPPASLISCLQKGVDDSEAILQAVAQLYVRGVTPDFETMTAGQDRRAIVLPTYPFQRRRFWGPDKPRAAHASYHSAHPLLGTSVSLAGVAKEDRYESFIDQDSPRWLVDHEVMGSVVVPGAAFVELALAAAQTNDVLDVVFEQPLRPSGRTALQTVVRGGETDEKSLETYSAAAGSSTWTRHFTARLVSAEQGRSRAAIDRSELESRCPETVAPADFYRAMQSLGLNYGPQFQTVETLRYSQTEVVAHLKSTGDTRGFTIPPTLLDGALHSLACGLMRDESDLLFLPVGMGRVRCYQSVEDEVWCHATWTSNEGNVRTADLTLFTEAGNVVAEIEGLRVRQVSLDALRKLSGVGSDRLLYEFHWQPFRLPAAATDTRNWLVVHAGQRGGLANLLTEGLSKLGHRTVTVCLEPGTTLGEGSDSTFRMCGESQENWERLFETLANAELPFAPEGIAWLFGPEHDIAAENLTARPASESAAAGLDGATRVNCSGLLHLITTLHARGLRRLECGLQLMTTDAVADQQATEGQAVDALQAQYLGLGRVIGAEQPDLRCRLIDISSIESGDPATSNAVLDILRTETRDNQFAVRAGNLLVPRLKQLPREHGTTADVSLSASGSFLITGGLGMLGRQAAKWLAEHGATQVVLVSRRAPDEPAREFLDAITATGCDVVVHLADLSSRLEVEQLFARFGGELSPLSGVIHAAGVLDDALIAEQDWTRFERVLAPKVIGARLLDEFTQELDLDFFVLYSSAASVLGSPGQSNYATANAFLDGLAWQRRRRGLPAASINWGPWSEGMAADPRITRRLALQGITPLTIEDAHAALEQVLTNRVVQATVIDADWRKMRIAPGGELPSLLEDLAPARPTSQMRDSELVGSLKRMPAAGRKELLVKTVQQSLQRILSTPELPDVERPLIEMGLDSLMAVEFGTELQQMLGDRFAIAPTMLFDHPTIDAISEHVLDLVGGPSGEEAGTTAAAAAAAEPAVIERHDNARERDDVAIIGMSCRFPGARDVDEFWENLLHGVDSVGEIPADRWDIDRFFSAEREPGKMVTREGGFVDDIGDFDAAFFNISEQEACWIDPQHRLLLENSYRALEDAGISPHPLADPNVGVFMGIMGQDYAFLPTLDDQDVIKAFEGAGLSHSAGVGRISYVFGFEGPSVAVDTASSSSLVALFQATRSLQDGACNLALAGGVNAILAPVNSLLMSKAGLLATDGRCKSFSAAADGFGRGEGCGVVVLKRLSDARRDGDRILAVVRGGAVVHNGFSGGITSPSGRSQARAIGDALKDARIAPSQVQYLEAHGTGTEYGDPMELSAAANAYGKGRPREAPLLVGSVKANISHLEAAGGISGVIKTVLALHHGVIPPQVHFDQPSPHIPWQRMPLKIVAETTPWPETAERIAGVTALGLVGTNAHILLSSAPREDAGHAEPRKGPQVGETPERTAHLLVLSGRNAAALEQLAERYRRFIQTRTDVDFNDICHTAATGRRHYEHRLAITAATRADAERQLANLHSNANGPGKQNGSAKGSLRKKDPVLPFAACVTQGTCRAASKIAWFFHGDEVSRLDSARELFAREPLFRNFVDELDQHLAKHLEATDQPEFPVRAWMESASEDSSPMPNLHLFLLQAGLARLWQTWGIEPDSVLGIGVGQYTAACLAGGMRPHDALTLVFEREKVLAQLRKDRARGEGETDIAQASSAEAVKASLDQFEAHADTLNYYPPNLPLICSMTGEVVAVHRSLGGSYWRQHCVAAPPSNSLKSLLGQLQFDCLLEIGPPGKTCPAFAEAAASADWTRLPSLAPNQEAAPAMLATLGELYIRGVNPDFTALQQHWSRRKVSLPTYPFQKKRYWITEVADYVTEYQVKK